MDITPLVKPGSQIIQSYGAGRFKISGQVYETPVIVFPEKTVVWELKGINPTLEDFAPLAARASEIDIVLVGGISITSALRISLKSQGLIIEAMETGAACRTWNVLLAEGRRVAAALFPV